MRLGASWLLLTYSLLTICVSSGKLLDLSEFSFLSPQSGCVNTCLLGLL